MTEYLHPWVKVDQAGRPLPPKTLSILVGLTLKLDSFCTIINVVGNIWTFGLFLENSRRMVSVTSVSPKAVMMANMLCWYY